MKNVAKAFIYVCILSFSSSTFAKNEFQLSKGTMELAGNLNFQIDAITPSNSFIGLKLNINPYFGYFVMDHLEIMASLNVGIGFEKYKDTTKEIFAGIGAKLFILSKGPVLPYIGFFVGPDFLIDPNGNQEIYIMFIPDFGILVPVGQSVALNIGVRGTIGIHAQDDLPKIFRIPMGWLGVDAFF